MAAALWAGVLLGRGLPVPIGAALLGVGVAGGAAAALSARGRVSLSGRLIEAARLREEEPRVASPRDRILQAAGIPVRDSRPGSSPEGPRPWLALTLACLIGGSGWASMRMPARPLGPVEGRYVEFSGRAATDARHHNWGWTLEANLDSVIVDGREWPIDLRAWVSGGAGRVTAAAGERIRGEGRLEAPAAGEFGDHLAARGIEAELRASSLEVLEGSEPPPLATANAVRNALRRGLARVLEERQAWLLLGLAIGDTSRLDPEIEEDFRASGLGHLLAVSGSNVATFLAPVLAMAGRMGARTWVRGGSGLLAVMFFALLTRWEPSVLRASAMAAIALVGVVSGRPRSTGPALGAAVAMLLVADPGLASSVGFELSVAATAGIAVMAGPVSSRLRMLPRPLALAVAATASAQLAVTPLLLLRFGVVPVVTLLSNVLAFPAVAPALLIGIPAAMAGLVWPGLGELAGRFASIPVAYLIAVADRTARFPLPSLTADGPLIPLLLTILVVAAAWRLRKRRRPVAALAAVAAVTAAAWAVPLGASRDTLTATFLDVGQGDAALVRSSQGATILIDAGPEEDDVATDLARLGVRRIDLAVATHAHADHVAGFPAVLARYPVSLLLDPGCPGDSPVYARYLDAVEDEGVRVRHPRGGDRFTVGDLEVVVLGPDRCSPLGEPNDDSIVLRVSSGGDSILFPGDAEVPSQEDMLEDGDPIGADVLKVPHHGGDTSEPDFLRATRAQVAVVSTGPNTYGHPVPSVLGSLRASGMLVYRTDLLGEVTVSFTSQGIVVVGSSQ